MNLVLAKCLLFPTLKVYGLVILAKEVHVNDVVRGIKHYSSASIHRKLKQLKKKKILLFELSPTDERVKIIKKGLHYNDYLAGD